MAASFLESRQQRLIAGRIPGGQIGTLAGTTRHENRADYMLLGQRRPTIFALSSGRPPAAIAIVRISGPAAFDALSALTNKSPPALRTMTLATIIDPTTGAALDRALVVGFAAGASVTGETLVELHLHGSIAVVTAVLHALGTLPELRMAQPGEFTRQAFDNGKLDLTEVEGLANLIAATTEEQRLHALESARGGLRQAVERWYRVVLDALASVEAELDFADEQADVTTAASLEGQPAALESLCREVEAALTQAGRGERLRDGLTVAIVGAPNVGKSSIMNALAMRDVAIVSPAPGTTRDLIELPFELDGLPFTLIDTAGLRADASDAAEQEGIMRARHRASTADLVLHVCTAAPAAPLGQVVVNKIDLSCEAPGYYNDRLHVSAATNAGIADLKNWLSDWGQSMIVASEPLLVSTRRQTAILRAFSTELRRAQQTSELVVKADALQAALRALSKLSGRYNVEAVLNEVFSRFCIGK